MLVEHLGYISDNLRIKKFRGACANLIKPGDIVADVGCGVGILGLLSLQAGAGHVYAIDENHVIDIARRTFAQAGLADQASFIRARAQHISLPEKADIVICDHVGYFGFDYGIVELYQHARQHFLKPGGKLVPRRLEIEVAAVSSSKLLQLATGWQQRVIPPEYHWLAAHSINSMHGVSLHKKDVLSDVAKLADIELGAEHEEFYSWTATVTANRAGKLHGIGAWFRSELAEDVWMTNSPLSPEAIRRPQVFLPVGDIPVKAGDVLQVTVQTRPADSLIVWEVEFSTGVRISHSTWEGMMLNVEQMSRLRPEHVPILNKEGRARAIILGYCDGVRTFADIQCAVCTDHPDLFPTEDETLRFVARVLGRCAE